MKTRSKKSSHINSLLVAGLLILAISLVWKRHEATKLSFVPSALDLRAVDDVKKQPAQVTVTSADIRLSVYETFIDSGVWKVDARGASHLVNSSVPGEKGSVIIYGHATKDRFGNLEKVKNGDKVTITNHAGIKYNYTVVKTVVVNPSQVEILIPEHNEELILYTCTGFADLKRFVVKAVPSHELTATLQ